MFGGLFKRPNIRDRRFQRLAVEMSAELLFPDRSFNLRGMVIEMSAGGALFREASHYILDRRRANVVLRVDGHEFPGVIVNVRSAGYGIRFDELVADDIISQMSRERAAA